MVSIIIPLYNSENTILKALESVKHQDYSGMMETIVVDDGSTDQSAYLVEDFIKNNPQMDIQLIRQANRGVSKARNTGLKLAKGEFIALLDSDDEWLSHKLSTQISILSDETIDLLATERNYIKMKFPYRPNPKGLAQVTLNKLLIRNEIAVPTVVFKRKILDAGLFFDERQRYAEDVNYWMRISLHFNLFILSETLVIAGAGKRSFGVSGLSANLREMAKGFQKNLYDLYQLKVLSLPKLIFYSIFYRLKYALLVLRCFFGKK